MKRKVLISGINGQDGSYLAEFLLEKDYDVYGLIRRSSTNNLKNIQHIQSEINLEYADLLDLSSLHRVFKYIKPDEVYNLAAQSHVGVSFEQPIFTCQVTGLGALNMLEAFKENTPYSRFYQAGSSEMFGNQCNLDNSQNEWTPFSPASPYACAKLFAHNIGINYRRSYDLFISNGILFNHESPRRGENFVTQKIVLGALSIFFEKSTMLHLGNLKTSRDWGHAKDYVKGMWMMLQHSDPDDFVLATGKTHSVEDLCRIVFEQLELDFEKHVVIDKKFIRPEDVKILTGDFRKARKILGWKPKYSFEDLLKEMIKEAKEKECR